MALLRKQNSGTAGRRLFWAVLPWLALLSAHASTLDKSGVHPNAVSLPKGPGSIEGLGESFQPTLNTGTAKYGVQVAVPPGVAGHTPKIGLAYDGGNGNGPLGFGWSLTVPFVRRETDKGIPRYLDSPADVFINESSEELVPQADGNYFCKNEGAFIRYRRNGAGWEGTLPDGTRMDFGSTAASQITDETGTRAFSWLLEKITDPNGNEIVFGYLSFSRASDLNQKYLGTIKYGPGGQPWANYHMVVFTYETRDDWFEDGRAGFLIRTGQRLKTITVATHGPLLDGHRHDTDYDGDGQSDNLVRSYAMKYEGHPHWSQLTSVTPFGADGVSTLPATTFTYTVCAPPDTLSASGAALGGDNEPAYGPDNPLVDLEDVNGDGVPDLLKTDAYGGTHTVYINRGEQGASNSIQWQNGQDMASADGLAWDVNLQSNSKVAYLADMDGDGLADLVCTTADRQAHYFRNTGKTGWAARQPVTVQGDSPPAPFSTPDVKTADLDFDKRIDIIQSIPTGGGGVDYRVWMNLGPQGYAAGTTVTQDGGFDFTQAGVDIVDFNGDRVPDVVRITPEDVKVTPGLGYGHFGALVSVPISDYTLTNDQVAKAKLRDITGDGLADLVIERAAPGELWYWINLGNNSFDTRRIITGIPAPLGQSPTVRWADMNGNGTTDLVYADSANIPRMTTIDIGRLLGCVPGPNQLVSIKNGLGRTTLVEYATSGTFALADAAANPPAPWPNPLPFAVNLVSRVRNQDSLGNEYETRFAYHEGYYDAVQHQFRGFARVEVTEIGDDSAPTLVTRHHFDTGSTVEAMKGKLLDQSATIESGAAFWNETTTWEPRELMTGVDGRKVVFAHPQSQAKDVLELGNGAPKRIESEFEYDNYGNETVHHEYGIVEGGNRSAGNDERTTTTEYALDLSRWMLRYPARKTLADASGTVVNRSETYYDDETFSGGNLGQVVHGNATLTRSWKNPTNPTAFVASQRTKHDAYGNPVQLLDPLAAAPAGVIDALAGHCRTLAYDPVFHTFPVQETIHVGGGKDDLVYSAVYDAAFGTVTSSTEFNGNTTTYGYDVFGRFINTIRPGDTAQYPGIEYEYQLAQPVGVAGLVNCIETRLLDRTPGSAGSVKRDHYLLSRTYVDGLGRTLLAKEEAEPDAGGIPRVAVKGAVRFNRRGQAGRALQPFFSSLTGDLDAQLAFEDIGAPAWQGGLFHDSGNLVSLDLVHAPQSATAYDALMRATTVTNPDGTQSRTDYEPLGTVTRDENDTDAIAHPSTSKYHDAPMAHFSDGLGRLAGVEERVWLNDDGTPADALKVWPTHYEYRADDLLTRIVDSQQNVKWMEYDGLGRKTFMNDPDRGVMNYSYDDGGNLTSTVDARSQEIQYAYDGVNRLLSEDYLDSAGRTPDVYYHYDVPVPNLDLGNNSKDTAANTKGRLAWVQDLSGEEHTSYDARGNEAWVVKRIPDPVSGVLVSYRTGMTHDVLDRVTTLIYPDEDRCTYQYNARNGVSSIIGGGLHNLNGDNHIIKGIDYAPSGQNTRIAYGNGVTTTYNYDARLRLSKLNTVRDADAARPLISYGYQFDGVSNITEIDDLRPATVHPDGDPLRNTQVFKYDDLQRITGVQYSFALPQAPLRDDEHISYRYDRIGNMLGQTSNNPLEENGLAVTNLGAMAYGGAAGPSSRQGRTNPAPGPHALTNVDNHAQGGNDTRVYDYDENGNMKNIDGLACTWDFKDRLVAAENATMRAEYSYDYTGRRISKKVRKYVNGTLEDLPSLTTLYINRFFEIREGGQPTKYVFNGETRVARIVGTLDDQTLRLQRIMLHAGWNLVSLAVNAADAASQLGLGAAPIAMAYRWDASSHAYLLATAAEPLRAGTVLWIKASQDAEVQLVGAYSEPADEYTIPDGAIYATAAALLAVKSNIALAAVPDPVWAFGDASKLWYAYDARGGDMTGAFPGLLEPAQPVYVLQTQIDKVTLPEQTQRIAYYCEDHLSSTTVTGGARGATFGESTYYPFGTPRNSQEDWISSVAIPSYGFSQKERDAESGLQYFEARYLLASSGRFITTDPFKDRLTERYREIPQDLNLYSYCGNPVKYVDNSGESATIAGVLLGAAIGAGSGLVSGLIQGKSGSELAAKVIGGAVTGAVAGAMAGLVVDTGGLALFASSAGVGAASSAAGAVAENAVKAFMGDKDVTLKSTALNVAYEATVGALLGGALGVAGKAVTKGLNSVISGSTLKTSEEQALSLFKLRNAANNPGLKKYAVDEAKTILRNARMDYKSAEHAIGKLVIDPALGTPADVVKGKTEKMLQPYVQPYIDKVIK